MPRRSFKIIGKRFQGPCGALPGLWRRSPDAHLHAGRHANHRQEHERGRARSRRLPCLTAARTL